MLTQKETLEITQKCIEAAVYGIYQAEAVTFAGEYGKQPIEFMLIKVKKETKRRSGEDLGPVAAGSRLRKLMRDYRNREAEQRKRNARAEEQLAAHDEMVAAYTKAYESGYRPTDETLRKQLDELYQNGDISIHDYEAGMRKLDGDESRRVGNVGDSLGGALSGVE